MEGVFNYTSTMVPRERYAHVYSEWRLLGRVSRSGDQQLSRWQKMRFVQHWLDLSVWPNESKGAEDSINGVVTKNRLRFLSFWLQSRY